MCLWFPFVNLINGSINFEPILRRSHDVGQIMLHELYVLIRFSLNGRYFLSFS